jgi:hypothetical protein
MQRFLTSAAVVALTLTVGGTAMASEREGGRRTFEHERMSFRESFGGHRFEHGYFFRGRDSYRFHHRYFSERYGAYCYYDEYTRCEYYFCVPDDCYYPISYCPYGRYSW